MPRRGKTCKRVNWELFVQCISQHQGSKVTTRGTDTECKGETGKQTQSQTYECNPMGMIWNKICFMNAIIIIQTNIRCLGTSQTPKTLQDYVNHAVYQRIFEVGSRSWHTICASWTHKTKWVPDINKSIVAPEGSLSRNGKFSDVYRVSQPCNPKLVKTWSAQTNKWVQSKK